MVLQPGDRWRGAVSCELDVGCGLVDLLIGLIELIEFFPNQLSQLNQPFNLIPPFAFYLGRQSFIAPGPQSVRASEIGKPRIGADAGAGKHHRISGFVQPLGQMLYFFICGHVHEPPFPQITGKSYRLFSNVEWLLFIR